MSHRSRRRQALWRLQDCIEPLEKRLFLSTVSWSSSSGGNWNTAGNWSTGTVPGSGDSVIINKSGGIKVTVSANTSVGSVQVTGDTLEVSAGTLTIGSSSGINSGATLLMDGGNVSLTGNLSNSGTITVNPQSHLSVSGAITQAGMLTLADGAASTGVGSNLVTNGDFEAPSVGTNTTTDPDVWGNWGASYCSTSYAYSGLQSLVESGGNSGVNQSFAVTPGVNYELLVYGMTPSSAKLSGAEGGFLNIFFYNASGTQLSGGASLTALNKNSAAGGSLSGSVGSQGWNLFSLAAAAPAGAVTATIALQAGAYTGLSGTSGGSVYWDDAQFGPQAYTSATVSGASLTNSGTLSIGGAASVNLSGGFTQTAAGTIATQLGGPANGLDYGSLTASGAASLAGKLSATLTGSYVPSISDSFNVLNYQGESGTFSSTNLPSSGSYVFQSAVGPFDSGISALPVSVSASINATSNITAVPTAVAGTNLAYWDDQLNTAQTQQMVESAGLTMLRFPGGSASDDFHFNVAANYGDGSANTIPQFAQFISAVGATGLVTTDYGSGSPQEAEAELAYLDGSPSDTTMIGTGLEWNDTSGAWQSVNWQTVGYWASLRSASPLQTNDGYNFLRINHAAAFTNIKYWEIGNEEYGSWEVDHHGTAAPGGVSTGAQHDPETYATFAEAFASFVAADKANFPTIYVGINSGDPSGASDNNWTRNVLNDGAAIGFVPGFISDHSYMQNPGSESDSFLLNDTVSDTGSLLSWATRYADYETLLKAADGSSASSVKVMATEYNSNWGAEGKQMSSIVNGLFVADSIGSLMTAGYSAGLFWDLRNGWNTTGNNSSSLYGWREGGDEGILGDPNITNDAPSTGPYVAYPTYFGEELGSRIAQAGGEVVSASSTYGALSVYSVLESNGHLDLMVINKNPDADINAQLNLSNFSASGQAQVWRYGEAEDYAQSQTSNGAASLTHLAPTLTIAGGGFNYTFPAYSMTVIDLAEKPTLSAAAASNPGTVTGTTAMLSATGTENGSGSGLTYTWATTASPNGAATPQFSANGTNGAANTTVTFFAAGSYSLQVTIADASGASITSSVNVTVNQTPTTVLMSPGNGTNLVIGGLQQFSATVEDQFGAVIDSPSINWSATGGTVSNSGLFTAGQTAEAFSVTAVSGSASQTSTGTISLPSWLAGGSVATWSPSTSILTVTGATTIDADPGAVEPIVEASGSGAVVTLNPGAGTIDLHLGGLSLTNGASATVTSLGSARSLTAYHLLVIGTPAATAAPLYQVDSTSTLNLADNDMAILYGSGATPLAQVQEELQSAYDNGAWDKPGLTSSVASSMHGATGLGYGEAAALGDTTFDGQSLGSNAVLVKYTLMGDSTLSGTVSGTDSQAVLGHYDTAGDWSQGNFHYGGSYANGTFTNDPIAGQDYNTVLSNYDGSLASYLPGGTGSPGIMAPPSASIATSTASVAGQASGSKPASSHKPAKANHPPKHVQYGRVP